MRENSKWLVLIFVLFVVLFIAQKDDASRDVQRSPSAVPSTVPVSEATWTDGPWPLTVSEGRLTCIEGAVYFEESVGDRVRRWPLTGLAQARHSQNEAMSSIDLIWRDAEPIMVEGVNMAPPKVNIGRMIAAALTVCE